ncbi:MAG: CreA family protein [Rhodocyclaceae bacterium]|nr:CreA family protein [Rhodocyclaceae bacterium]
MNGPFHHQHQLAWLMMPKFNARLPLIALIAKGALRLAEDKAEASIACRQTGVISFGGKALEQQEEMYSERISLVFKKLRVVRMVDAKRNTLVYLTYSDRLIEGSPQNSVTAVPVPAGTVIPVSK